MEKSDVFICHTAATGNNIQVLEWFKNNFPNTFWKEKVLTGFRCILIVADHGNLRMLEWLKGNNFPFEFDLKKLSSFAVSKRDNSLEVLQYVMRSCNCPLPDDICDKALEYGRLDILLWAVSNGCPWNPNPNDILFAVACSRVATATPDILNWIADHYKKKQPLQEIFPHLYGQRRFIRRALRPSYWEFLLKILLVEDT